MSTSPTVRWIVTLLVGGVFAGAGVAKLIGNPRFSSMFREWGYPSWSMYAIGMLEILCVLLLGLPRFAPYAVLSLLAIAMGALVAQAVHGELWAAVLPALLAAGAALLAWSTPGHAAGVRARLEGLFSTAGDEPAVDPGAVKPRWLVTDGRGKAPPAGVLPRRAKNG